MSYTLTLFCGCALYVSCHPRTGVAHTRIIESRGPGCTVRRHEVGLRLYLWEMLPDRRSPPPPIHFRSDPPDPPGLH
jgi:hypothetical protein